MLNRFPQDPLKIHGDLPRMKVCIVFIGGFADCLTGAMSKTREYLLKHSMLPEHSHTAYYHWDGCAGGMFCDRHHNILFDLARLRTTCPSIPILMIGHSYGGSTAMNLLRLIPDDLKTTAPMSLITLDPVSRRQVRARASHLAFWGNVYLREPRDFRDIVPLIGGTWKHRHDADCNISVSGKNTFAEKRRYVHRLPTPMLITASQGNDTILNMGIRSLSL